MLCMHVVGFSRCFGFTEGSYPHPPELERCLKHFWKPAAVLPRSVQTCSIPPTVTGYHRSALMLNDCLRLEGLLPVTNPCISVCGPSVFYPRSFVRRPLTREEFLAVYDIPTRLHQPLLLQPTWNASTPLPFEFDLSSAIVASIFRQLWSSDGGGFSFFFGLCC